MTKRKTERLNKEFRNLFSQWLNNDNMRYFVIQGTNIIHIFVPYKGDG